MDSKTLKLAKALIEKPSVTPNDAGCQALIADELSNLGFSIYELPYEGVQNLFACYTPSSTSLPYFAFAGHTDVVPPGRLDEWHTPPFKATIKEGLLYGRGAADMKGSLAAMITACERFLKRYPNPKTGIAFLITSDEEGDAKFGTLKIMEHLKSHNVALKYCIVGEPSSVQTLGDTIKVGRRGSMTGRLKILGKQGHIAYPHKADNPIHRILAPLDQLAKKLWDEGDKDFPPTSFQISNINSGTGAGNVIPGILECLFNFRFSPKMNPSMLQEQVHTVLNEHGIQYELEWQLFGNPFLTVDGALIAACKESIQEILGQMAIASTDGGTSDARFIAGENTEVIELGPSNATIHAVNECVSVSELEKLSEIYERILEKLIS